jgi:hypothetical protein
LSRQGLDLCALQPIEAIPAYKKENAHVEKEARFLACVGLGIDDSLSACDGEAELLRG